ncbi:MAG: hypothetical protein ABSH05_03625 [Bryobacteraceae bacterium]|jgi:hypothetical protein
MNTKHKWVFFAVLAFALAGALPGLAQDSSPATEPSSGGWRKFAEAPPADPQPVSSQLTLPVGTWITVRVDEPLSSDHNQPGDTFTATLVQPLVANGRVVARRGQTVAGVVAQAEKAGRAKGTSSLGLQLTELGLADGRQIQVKTRLMERRGDTSVGRDAAAIGTTTGVGAAIGAAADGGFGAGMGAIAGAAASTIGVLLTRGKPTVVYPEDMLTFRLEAPLTISTDSSPDAFPPVVQEDYQQRPSFQQRMSSGPPPPYYGYYGYPYPNYYSYFYPPYFWGPGFYFYSGPRFSYRGGHFHR